MPNILNAIWLDRVTDEESMSQHQGRHFLQIPGPSPVPDRVLRAMDMPVIDHRSPEFAELGKAVFEGCQKVFKTAGSVIIFPSSGTGAWEAAIVKRCRRATRS
jgi:alanine-glyoxylate transaminase / serine-glyoxylate transaminase / serine-pyruvate transaminase